MTSVRTHPAPLLRNRHGIKAKRELMARASSLPAAFSILSSLKFYGDAKGHGLPGTWFVETLSALGVPSNTVRQALYRLEQQRGLVSQKVGRTKIYSTTPAAGEAVQVGTEKLFRTGPVEPWDGQWTLVHLQIGPERVHERNRLLDVLRVEGFAALAEGVFIHPRDRSHHILNAARDLGVAGDVAIFRGHRSDGARPDMTAALWDLAVIRLQYEKFIAAFEPLAGAVTPTDKVHAFAGRLLVVHDFLAAAWHDPDLPPELLPDDWPAARARRLARRLYDQWRRGALAFSDEALARVTLTEPIVAVNRPAGSAARR